MMRILHRVDNGILWNEEADQKLMFVVYNADMARLKQKLYSYLKTFFILCLVNDNSFLYQNMILNKIKM